jgi:hypothetical protein
MPGKLGRRFVSAKSWGWDALAEPRDLVAELGREAQVTIAPLTAIPHDLWPAVSLPSLRWTDRLTIVLAGFGLTYHFAEQGRAVQLVDLPAASLVKRAYPSTLPQARLEDIAARFPQATVSRVAGGIELEGTAEEHERLRRILAPQEPARSQSQTGSRTVHSLRVNQQPVGAILRTLEVQLELAIELGPGVAEKLRERVSFDLREVSLEELLSATLEPVRLKFSLNGETVRIDVEP